MKYVIVLVLCLLYIFLFPVRAREVSSDSYIIEYEPVKEFSTRSKFIPNEAKRRMPIENYAYTNTKVKLATPKPVHHEDISVKPFIIPEVVYGICVSLRKTLSAFQSRYISTISAAIARMSSNRETGEVKGLSKKTSTRLEEPKKPDFTSLPLLQSVHGLNSRFAGDPYSSMIPEKAKEVYTWDRLWNPAYNPQHYLQCTTYVAMIYNLNGISLHGKVSGDAREWIHFTDTFSVFENGNTRTKPEVMDIVVWATNGSNHVGVISEVTDSSVTIINANAEQISYRYTLSVSDEGIVSLSGNTNWVPSHWMRIKP